MSNELKPCQLTAAETIHIFENSCLRSEHFTAESVTAAYVAALAALRAKDTPNPPLTLDELRDLAGKEAVYAVSSADKGHWCVIDTAPRFGGGTAIIAIYGRGLTLGGDDYGTLWLAYRRKPEKETK